jgi:hypothetical protein
MTTVLVVDLEAVDATDVLLAADAIVAAEAPRAEKGAVASWDAVWYGSVLIRTDDAEATAQRVGAMQLRAVTGWAVEEEF